MADELVHVDTDVVGGDGSGSSWENAYSSLAAWNAGQAKDLTAIGNHTVLCRGTALDTSTFTIGAPWVTDATHQINIIGNFENGIDNSTGIYTQAVGAAYAKNIIVSIPYVNITGLSSGNNTAATNGFNTIIEVGAAANPCNISANEIWQTSIGSTVNNRGYGVFLASEASGVTITNNVIRGFFNSGIGHTGSGSLAKNYNIYNNTIVGEMVYGIRLPEINITAAVKNNIIDVNRNAYVNFAANISTLYGTFDIDYNIVSDASASNTNDIQNTSLTFANYAANDFHLAAADTVAMGAGVGPGIDANVPTVDLSGTARSGNTTDIGAFLYIPPLATLTAPVEDAVTDTTATVGVTTDVPIGTLYAVVSALEPSAAQIIAGTDSLDVISPSANKAVAGTDESITVAGLTAEQAYTVWVLQSNGSGESNIVSLAVTTTPTPKTVTTAASHVSGSTITFTPADFGGAITNAILTDSNGNTLALTGVTNTQGNCPAFDTSGQDRILYGTTTLTITDGIDIAMANFELVPALGYTVVTAASLINPAVEGNWHYPPTGGWANPVVDGDQAFTNDPFITLNADGSKTYDPANIVEPYDFVYFTIDATDGVLTKVTETFEAAGPDIINPTAGSLSLTVNSSTQIRITHIGASDNEGVDHVVLQISTDGINFSEESAAATFPYVDSGLNPSTQYWYRAVVYDAAGNNSTTAVVTASTPAASDVTDPIAGTLSLVVDSSTQITVGHSGASDNIGIDHVVLQISTDGINFNEESPTATFPYVDTGLTPSTQYWYRAIVYDAAGNTATVTNTATTNAAIDVTAPVAGTLAISAISDTRTNISLSGQSDAVGISNITLQWSPNGVTAWTTLNANWNGSIYSHTGLSPETQYFYRALVSDAAGNTSTAEANATTQPTPLDIAVALTATVNIVKTIDADLQNSLKIYRGQSLRIVFTVKDENGAIVDISGPSEKTIYLKRVGSWEKLPFVAQFQTDGTDGVIFADMLDSEINTSGIWKAQAVVVSNESKYVTSSILFEVVSQI